MIPNTEYTLTETTVNIKVLKVMEVRDGVPITSNYRRCYSNTVSGRQMLLSDEWLSEEQKQKILAFWGDPMIVSEENEM